MDAAACCAPPVAAPATGPAPGAAPSAPSIPASLRRAAPAETPASATPAADPAATLALIASRRQSSPRRLLAPGPDAAQQRALFEAAASAPDHGCLTPWRFIVVPPSRRAALGDAFAAALLERDAQAAAADLEAAAAKAAHAPFLAVAVTREDPLAPADERLLSLGCALQNMLLAAQAMGFGSGLVSGPALRASAMRRLLRLHDDERAVCFVAVGSVREAPAPRLRPQPEDFVGTL
ncbi:putative NAD(P)H nitroreductase YdjA [mine drainage metagenome]|uniref:Putative NAD(P)H nitroreductase YdjA n=1 Tax=mine drainage metagenome TaxID=410659 RepID=A0A1J5RDX2_9ZZZZ